MLSGRQEVEPPQHQVHHRIHQPRLAALQFQTFGERACKQSGRFDLLQKAQQSLGFGQGQARLGSKIGQGAPQPPRGFQRLGKDLCGGAQGRRDHAIDPCHHMRDQAGSRRACLCRPLTATAQAGQRGRPARQPFAGRRGRPVQPQPGVLGGLLLKVQGQPRGVLPQHLDRRGQPQRQRQPLGLADFGARALVHRVSAGMRDEG